MKRIKLAVVFIILPLAIFAQGPISFGPKVGWNSGRLTTDNTQYVQDFKNGFQCGFFLSLYVKKLYIQPEAYLSIKRGALETSISDPLNPGSTLNISQKISLQSIDIPLLIGIKALDLKLIRFRVWGGPVVSYVMNKDYTLSINGVNQSDRIVKDDFRNSSWAGQVGAGLDVLFLTFDVGYEFGVDNILTIRSLDNFSFRNNLFYCSVGWRLF